MAVQGTVDKVVFPAELAHGTGFPERLLFIGGSLCLFAGENAQILNLVAGDNGQHVAGVQLKPHGAVFRGLGTGQQKRVAGKREPGIEVQPPVLIHQAAGVKLERFPPFPDGRPVGVLYIAQKLVFPRRFVAHRHGDHFRPAHEVIEVIPPVRTRHHVRGRQTVGNPVSRRGGILFPLVNAPVIRPVSQVVHRRGPADIVSEAEVYPVEQVMGTIDVHPVPHNVRFRVRHILPAWQVRIQRLSGFHTPCPFPLPEFMRISSDCAT